jgi:hypothetical protein
MQNSVPSPDPTEEPAPSNGPRANFIVRFWRGDERLWKTYWLAGVLGSNIIGGLTGLAVGLGFIPAIVGLVVMFIYFVWAAVSIWTSAPNCDWKPWGYIARAVVVVGFLVMIAKILNLV